jgi:CheY-like chemotaxis protein
LLHFQRAVNYHGPCQGPILIGDDNDDDAALTEAALIHSQIRVPVQIVHDGEQVIDYVRGAGAFADRQLFPFPSLLLLDLHMPHVNGLEVVAAIRSAPLEYDLPIVIISGSDLADNVANAYSVGANEFIYKTTDFATQRDLIGDAVSFWLAQPIVCLRRPPRGVRFWNPSPNIISRQRNRLALSLPR